MSSNVIVHITWRSEFSFAARIAALVSIKSVIVSITIISAPAFLPAITSSLKISYASSKERLPVGSSNWPIGPISKATSVSVPLAASFALLMAAPINSSTEYPVLAILYLFAPKVLA